MESMKSIPGRRLPLGGRFDQLGRADQGSGRKVLRGDVGSEHEEELLAEDLDDDRAEDGGVRAEELGPAHPFRLEIFGQEVVREENPEMVQLYVHIFTKASEGGSYIEFKFKTFQVLNLK
jgi:hypothetical protein